MKATILYQSKKGRTAGYARAMAMYLWSKGMSVSYSSVSDFKPEQLEDCDLLMLGCWTSGWFIVNQHPNELWVDFAQKLPETLPPRIILFATYKFHTGSMFGNMKKHLSLKGVKLLDTLKSKAGILSQAERDLLDRYVAEIKTEHRHRP